LENRLDCQALWLDPFQAAGELERSRLAGAGLALLPVRTLDDLRNALNTASLIVVRLVGDADLLVEVRRLLSGFKQSLPVVCRVASGDLSLAAEAIRQGAFSVVDATDFEEPTWMRVLSEVSRFQSEANESLRPAQAAEAGVTLPAPPASPAPPARTFVFADPSSQKLLALTQKVAQAQVTTLVTGPTGAGKEVLATIIHEASPRVQGPMVSLNCSAIPEHLMEDMLFGHEKGAYTGAIAQHRGIFEQAHGGTVFLDEIGEMPLALQAKLLRVLQDKKVTRLGGQQAIDVDFRLVAATNRDLRTAMQAREFREDLYFRISTFRLAIPALSERREDIIPMASQFLRKHTAAQGLVATPLLSEEAQLALLAYHWPGNVRELDNVIQRALVLCQGPTITVSHLLFDDGPSDYAQMVGWLEPQPQQPLTASYPRPAECSDVTELASTSAHPIRLQDAVKSNEHQMILRAIESAPTKAEAAKRLGISPRTLRYKMAQLKMAGAA